MVYVLPKWEIREFYSKGEYSECSFHLKELLKSVIQDEELNKKQRDELIWFYYFYKANILKQKNKYEESLELCCRCLKYIEIKDRYNSDYKFTLYLLGRMHERLENKKQAKIVYKHLLKLTNDKKCETLLKYKLYKLENNIKFHELEKEYKECYNEDIQDNLGFCQYF